MLKKIYLLLVFAFVLVACEGVTKQETDAQDAVEAEVTTTAKVRFSVVEDAVLSSGTLYRIENFESEFVSPRNIDVWVPSNYHKDSIYASLYMHDGQMLFDSTTTWNKQEWKVDETLSRLMEEGKIKPTIAIGMWNVDEDRHTDYFPQKPFEGLDQATQQRVLEENHAQSERLFRKPLNADNYLKFITEEVLPLVEANFAVSRSMKNRAVAGSSMGGLISWYVVVEKPYVFSTAICMSTHWPGAMPIENNPLADAFFDYLRENLPQAPSNHKFYFDFGTETLDALYPPFEDEVNAVFAARNYKESSFKNLKFEGTDHSEHAWNQRLHIPLEFALYPEMICSTPQQN
jgi:predicted alpha/beta superfamily hydrolase